MEQRLLYRPTEAADLLGLSRARLYELLAAGQLRSVVIGRSRRIPATALVEFIDELGGGAPAPAVPHDTAPPRDATQRPATPSGN